MLSLSLFSISISLPPSISIYVSTSISTLFPPSLFHLARCRRPRRRIRVVRRDSARKGASFHAGLRRGATMLRGPASPFLFLRRRGTLHGYCLIWQLVSFPWRFVPRRHLGNVKSAEAIWILPTSDRDGAASVAWNYRVVTTRVETRNVQARE